MAVSATVTPSKIFSSDEVVTISSLNLLGAPTVDISGAVGSLTLADGSVTNAKIIVPSPQTNGVAWNKMYSLATNELVVGNAGTPTATALTGDIRIAAGGAVTIEDDAVTTDKVIDAAVTGPKIAMGSDVRGDILIRGTTNYERLAPPGSPADEVLTFAEGANVPSWQANLNRPLNFQQYVLTDVAQVYNHATESVDPAEGTRGDDEAFWLVKDDSADSMQTSGFTIADGNKVRISLRISVSTNDDSYPVAGKVQRASAAAPTVWTDLAVGNEASTRVRVGFVGGNPHSTGLLGF